MHQKLVFWMDTCISSLYSDVGCHSLYNCCSNESHRTVCSLKIVCKKPVFYCFIVKRLQIDFFVWLSMCNLVEMRQTDCWSLRGMNYGVQTMAAKAFVLFLQEQLSQFFWDLKWQRRQKKLEPTWQPTTRELAIVLLFFINKSLIPFTLTLL